MRDDVQGLEELESRISTLEAQKNELISVRNMLEGLQSNRIGPGGVLDELKYILNNWSNEREEAEQRTRGWDTNLDPRGHCICTQLGSYSAIVQLQWHRDERVSGTRAFASPVEPPRRHRIVLRRARPHELLRKRRLGVRAGDVIFDSGRYPRPAHGVGK